MNKIKAIIVDDEAASRETLFNYLTKYCPTIDVIAQCKNIIEAEDSILSTTPQLVFLDIEMPFGNGFDLLEKMQKQTSIKEAQLGMVWNKKTREYQYLDTEESWRD